ncbi:unnamed protein product [Leptidea sinapis]|uniref:PID domain-containing protein n=1 Tax=Leptidea sinapis TaxID=189913 RepID=A0A5E4QE09_9NEOP|nr:unnamed protein product [Leptidea sinapis]
MAENGPFVAKPARGWLHPDSVLASDGITYAVRYIGSMEILTSMKKLDFETRSQRVYCKGICCRWFKISRQEATGQSSSSVCPGSKTQDVPFWFECCPNCVISSHHISCT